MIKYLAAKLTGFVCSHMKTSQDMIDVYSYGFEITISSILNIVLVSCCGIILGDVLAGFIYMFCLIFLRIFTGGYHATNYLRCNIAMVVSFLLTYALYRILIFFNTDIKVLEAILLVSGLPIVIFAPVKNVHKELSPSKRKKFQIISIIVYICLSILALTALLFKIKYGTLIIVTVMTVSVMILVEIFMQRRGFHES